MKQELVRVARKVGTSAGVILPIKLLGATVKISVLEEPVNPLMDCMKILGRHKLASDVLSVVLVGSYARGENEVGSDVDILVISKNSNMIIEEGKYSVVVVSRDRLEGEIGRDVAYCSMVYEGVALVNGHLLDELKKVGVADGVLKRFVRETRVALGKARKMIGIDEKLGNRNTGDSVAYSLVLRIRSLMILEKIREGGKFRKRELIKVVGDDMYERYRAVKNGKMGNGTSIVEAKALIEKIEGMMK